MSETIIDTTYIYTTRYTNYDEISRAHVQKTVTLAGVEGKQISIELIAMKLGVEATGVTASALVTAEVDGIDTKIAEFTETSTAYTDKSQATVFVAPAGKGVTLRFHLKTSKGTYKAKMKEVAYTYSLVAEPEPEPEPTGPCLVAIECVSEASADSVVKAINDAGYITDEIITIYKEV